MSLPRADETAKVLDAVAREAAAFLEGLDDALVRDPGADAQAAGFGGSLPDEGVGAAGAIGELLDVIDTAAVRSPGPRFFHFVTGGVTPAALGADWLASTIDQMNSTWVSSPLGTKLESVSVGWLQELFGIPASWGGVLTTGATMANVVALACARRWWGLHHGIDIDREGMAGVPSVPVFAGGYLHPSDTKALGMLGIGRDRVRVFARDDAGRVDLDALEAALAELDGAPSIVICSAGEVNTGDFDPVAEMADLTERYGAWLHVDGAFGLFAACSPRSAHLVAGVERADSVIADGHKWLNVPYDCGFAFVRDPSALGHTFSLGAPYLPEPDDERPNYFSLGPESSRRARSLAVWATLRAYGRRGYQELVERHLDLAAHLARRVDDAPDLERLADVPLNIVCFRGRPNGVPDGELDALNARVAQAIVGDGRVLFGSTTYRGVTAFRPAIVNWRTRTEDVDLLVEVTRELLARSR
jgi:glutamate/tyrosine decarboxylase-like PLP-dependent enzyme